MPDPIMVYSVSSKFNILFGLFALVFFNYSRAKFFWLGLALGWVTQITAFFIKPGPLSLSGVESTFTLAAVVVLFCQGLRLKKDLACNLIRPRITYGLMIFLGLGSILPESAGHNSFMTIYPFAVIFFLSRPLSLGTTLFALAGMIDVFSEKSKTLNLSTSKSWAFLSAMIFLGGEIAGCYWGFVGWGTTWRWSGNFYFSAMIFVLYMLSLHLPPSFFSSTRSRLYSFFVPLVTIAVTTIFSKVINL